jgi:hypothetical protein
MVGEAGFEPTAFASRTQGATRLRYSPIKIYFTIKLVSIINVGVPNVACCPGALFPNGGIYDIMLMRFILAMNRPARRMERDGGWSSLANIDFRTTRCAIKQHSEASHNSRPRGMPEKTSP